MPSAHRKKCEARKARHAAEKASQSHEDQIPQEGSSIILPEDEVAGPSNAATHQNTKRRHSPAQSESNSSEASNITPNTNYSNARTKCGRRAKKRSFLLDNSTPTRSESMTPGPSNIGSCSYDANVEVEVPEQIESQQLPTVYDTQSQLMPPPQVPRKRGRPKKGTNPPKPQITPQNTAIEPTRRSARISDIVANRPQPVVPPTPPKKLKDQQRERELSERAAKHINKHKTPTYDPPKLEGNKVTRRCNMRHPNLCCGSNKARHAIEEYFSGDPFSGVVWIDSCDYCKAKLLRSEKDAMNKNCWAKCCAYGQVHTATMQEEYDELQDPPEDLRRLTHYKEDAECKNFTDNTLPLNNSFAFGSISVGKADPNDREMVGSRRDTCKLNGEFTFNLSDLYAPNQNAKPLFGQTYCIDPETAINFREENFTNSGLPLKIKKSVIEIIEKIIRENHPFATAYKNADTLFKEAIAKNVREGKDTPRFRLTILTKRDLQDNPILNTDVEGINIIRNNEPAENAKQIAVIWISDEGLAPEVSGIWLDGTDGKTYKLNDEDPNLDPACFPLLFPKGTQGYRFGIPKNPDERPRQALNREQRDQQNMEDVLANVNDQAIIGEDTGDDTVIMRPINTSEKRKTKKKGERQNFISMRQLWRYRTFFRPTKEEIEKEELTGIKKVPENKNYQFHWLWTMKKLAEFFIISVLNRIEHNEMKWVKLNQENLRSTLAKDLIAALEKGVPQGGTLGKVHFTPATMYGSRQYYQRCYANLQTLARTLGQPTWFVTFTGNPDWPEIKELLADGQEYTNRADVVCRIFIDKAKEFVKDVTDRGVLGKVSGWCYSVEHQKRGMPHIHLLLILDKDAEVNRGLGTPEFVDQFVSARIPNLPNVDDESEEAKQQRRLWDAVTTMNLHDCDNKAPCRFEKVDKNGNIKSVCNKRFPKDYSPETVLSAVRYTEYTRVAPQEEFDAKNADLDQDNREQFDPETLCRNYDADGNEQWMAEDLNPDNDPDNSTQYRRLPPPPEHCAPSEAEYGNIFYKTKGNKQIRLTDRHVVPYNAFLLLKYRCHINIEYVFGQAANKYIFKYILKGHEQAYVKVAQSKDGGNEYDYDEIAATFKVRYMTSMEAYLRLFGYPIVENSHIFATMPVITPDSQVVVFEEGKEGDALAKIGKTNKLSGFFDLCSREDEDGEEARKLRYDQVEKFFWWDKGTTSWIKRKRLIPNLLIRVYTVSPKNMDLFALRALLLYKVGPTCFEDLCILPSGEVCLTAEGKPDFQRAARELNLLTNDNILLEVLQDAAVEMSNERRLQNYFATLIYHQNPTNAKELFDTFLDRMCTPGMNVDEQMDRERRKQKVLNNLEYYLSRFGTTCENVGLYRPTNYNHMAVEAEIEREELSNFSGVDRNASDYWEKMTEQNVAKMKDNPEQKDAYEQIINSVDGNNTQKLFFLEGAGGCGKTFLYNTLIARMKCKAVNKKVVACASTAIAALLLIGGGTAHRKFRVPTNGLNRQTKPGFEYQKADAQYLQHTDLIIIDEVSMLHRDVFDFIDRTLRSVMPAAQRHLPFGGKTVVIGGDWKQLLPVVPGGNRHDQIQASIKQEAVFKSFKILRLKKNMRADADQQEFCKWLFQLGMGRLNDMRGEVEVPQANTVNSMEELIAFTFQDLFANPIANSDIICDAAILSPRNDGVKEINDIAMAKLNSEERIYLSTDEPLPSGNALDHHDVFAADFNLEAVHEETPTGLPPHRLALRVGAPVMLIRNIDVNRGNCNGTRYQIIKMTDHNLVCKVLTGPNRGETEYIHKITIKYGTDPNVRGLQFKRYQFPVRPCFAMTNNKAQGQTLQRVGLALNRQQCFAHGQVYVAASRVTRMSGIRVFSTTSSAPNKMKNIVYNEILDLGN